MSLIKLVKIEWKEDDIIERGEHHVIIQANLANIPTAPIIKLEVVNGNEKTDFYRGEKIRRKRIVHIGRRGNLTM
jgi:hypothetical protein